MREPRDLLSVDWSQLPTPEDDGAADHLTNSSLPAMALTATDGRSIDLSRLPGRTVAFVYPLTGRPDRALPAGWEQIAGARGCTPQACSFRDLHAELKRFGSAHVFGLSAQDTEYQREAAARLHLPFPLLSDSDLAFSTALRLPTFRVENRTLLKRLTMIIDNGKVTHVFYPVFPPDRNAQDVLDWLKENPA